MHIANPLLVPFIASIVAVTWGAVIQRSRTLRRDYHDASGWVYWGGFVTLALTITLPLPPVMAEIDRLFGNVGLADFVADAASLATCWCWLTYLYLLLAPDPDRPRVPVRLLLALATGAVLVDAGRFLAAPGRLGFQLGPHPDRAAAYLAYAHLLYRGVMLVHLAYGIALLYHYRAIVRGENPTLGARLHLFTWVMWFTLAYAAYDALTVLLPVPSFDSRLLRLRALLMLGVAIAPRAWFARGLAIAERLERDCAPLAWLRRYQDYRRLYPLWRTLWPVRPQLSLLPPPGWAAWWPGMNLSFRLHRLVAEIHDWRLALRPYRNAAVARQALDIARFAHCPPERRSALVEAVTLAVALRRWEAGDTGDPVPAIAGRDPLEEDWLATSGESFAEEVRALGAVADAWRSRLARTILEQCDQAEETKVPHQGLRRHPAIGRHQP